MQKISNEKYLAMAMHENKNYNLMKLLPTITKSSTLSDEFPDSSTHSDWNRQEYAVAKVIHFKDFCSDPF